ASTNMRLVDISGSSANTVPTLTRQAMQPQERASRPTRPVLRAAAEKARKRPRQRSAPRTGAGGWQRSRRSNQSWPPCHAHRRPRQRSVADVVERLVPAGGLRERQVAILLRRREEVIL